MLIHELLSFVIATYQIIFQGVLSFSSSRKLRPLEKWLRFSSQLQKLLDNRKPIILTYMELITRESETILPLFLSYPVLPSSFLFGIKIYKTFYRSRDCCVIWHLGWDTIMSFRFGFDHGCFRFGWGVWKTHDQTSKLQNSNWLRPLEKWTVSHELR